MRRQETYLSKILEQKKVFLENSKRSISLKNLKKETEDLPNTKGFLSSLILNEEKNGFAVIAEMKKASPSLGLIRENYSPSEIAEAYSRSGASCLSVLTDENFFQGSLSHLSLVSSVSQLPVIRKDFIIDEYQIYETRANGADCLLLIKSALSNQQLSDYYFLAKELSLDVLIEIHDEEELNQILELNPKLIGVNNRNLTTFKVDINNTKLISQLVPKETTLVCESGIRTKEDISFIKDSGVKSFLVGEAFMKAKNPGDELLRLFF